MSSIPLPSSSPSSTMMVADTAVKNQDVDSSGPVYQPTSTYTHYISSPNDAEYGSLPHIKKQKTFLGQSTYQPYQTRQQHHRNQHQFKKPSHYPHAYQQRPHSEKQQQPQQQFQQQSQQQSQQHQQQYQQQHRPPHQRQHQHQQQHQRQRQIQLQQQHRPQYQRQPLQQHPQQPPQQHLQQPPQQHPQQPPQQHPQQPLQQHPQQPPQQHPQQPPQQHLQQPPQQHLQQPPQQHLQQPPQQHLQQPPQQHLQQPPQQHLQQPPQQHLPKPPQQHFQQHSQHHFQQPPHQSPQQHVYQQNVFQHPQHPPHHYAHKLPHQHQHQLRHPHPLRYQNQHKNSPGNQQRHNHHAKFHSTPPPQPQLMNSQQPPTDTQTFSTSSLPLSAANDIDSSMKQAQTLSSAVSSETSSNDITTTYPIFGQIAYGAMLYPTLVPLTGNKKEERKVALSSYQSPSFQTSSQIPNNVSLDSTSSSSLLTMTSSTSISTPTQTLTPSLPTYSQEETEKHTSDATTCKPCEKSFDSIDQFENHKKTHVTCSECSFEAIKSLVQKHNEEVHGRNKEKNSMPPNCIRLDTPEDIEKWIAERKKNYPTDTNIQLKNERQKKLHQQEQNGLKIFQPPPFPVTPTISKKKPTSRPSLMSKLLEKERIQDHSFLLQCCRFFVNNKFFINGLIWLPSNDSSSS